MTDSKGMEFTGERVIPELVDADLFNEHLARYAFANQIAARQFAQATAGTPRILDAGCGSGYGAAELSAVGSVAGVDVSADAIKHAQSRYGGPRAHFLQAGCEALPFPDAGFDIVVAFEVIEHLDRWQEMLAEANRVLKPSGVLLVSTPNREYYAESRAAAGPNPFHRHEFDFDEFRAALEGVFPHVRIWTQNHAEGIVFSSPEASSTGAASAGRGSRSVTSAHFYFAACSQSPIPVDSSFVWLPATGNVLQERERHIAKLTSELTKKDAWLRENLDAHNKLQRKHEAVTEELVVQNNWGAELTRELFLRNARIAQLQEEQEARLSWIAGLELDISRTRTEAGRLQREHAQQGFRIAELQDELETRLKWVRGLEEELSHARAAIARLEPELAERTAWAQRLDAENAGLKRVADSKWTRAGMKLGLVPGKPSGK